MRWYPNIIHSSRVFSNTFPNQTNQVHCSPSYQWHCSNKGRWHKKTNLGPQGLPEKVWLSVDEIWWYLVLEVLDMPSYVMVVIRTTWNLLEIFNNAHDNMNFHLLPTTNFTPGPGPFLPIPKEICRQSIQNPSLVTWGNLVTDLFLGVIKSSFNDGNTHIGYINFGFMTLIWKWWDFRP